MYLRIHEMAGKKVVAVCDEDLVGRVLEDAGGAYLDLERYKSFYVGNRAGELEVKDALAGFSSANLVGKESVGVAVGLKLARSKDIMYIKKTPYLQIYRV